jgi:hypothetical protein
MTLQFYIVTDRHGRGRKDKVGIDAIVIREVGLVVDRDGELVLGPMT